MVLPYARAFRDAARLTAWLRAQAIEWRQSEGIPGFPHAAAVADFYAGLGDEIGDATGPKMQIVGQRLLPPARRAIGRRAHARSRLTR